MLATASTTESSAYRLGYSLGMEKRALGLKNWARLLRALKRETPKLFDPSITHAELRRALKLRFSELSHVAPHGLQKALIKLEQAASAGKPLTGRGTQAALQRIRHAMGLERSQAGALRSVAPRALLPRELGRAIGRGDVARGTTFRGTTMGKLVGIPEGSKIWASGDPDIAKLYSLGGGAYTGAEPGALDPVISGNIIGKLLLRLKPKAGLKFSRHPSIEQGQRKLRYVGGPQSTQAYETVLAQPKGALEEVERAYRVFAKQPSGWIGTPHEWRVGRVLRSELLGPTSIKLNPRERSRLWQRLHGIAPSSAHYATAPIEQTLQAYGARFVPIPSSSLQKWRAALRAPDVATLGELGY